MADKLGQPFMPWQSLVADVGGEIDPLSGLPAYREVVVTIPRQSGKTTLFLSWQINRCVSRRWRHPQRSAFTAQTGKDARDKWIDELYPLIRNSRLKELVSSKGSRLEINEGMGNESIKFKTGSIIRLLSTSASSGHSKTLHQAVMDEVWHDSDDRREQGLRPAMITVQDAQLLVCSTAGTEASLVLNRKVDTGREAALVDSGHGIAYFEWSAPLDWDPEDEASYFSFMPALCPNPPCRCAPAGQRWRHTITLGALRAERQSLPTAEYRRAYGNVKTGHVELKWSVISELEWGDAGDGASTALDPLVFALDVNPERTRSCIAAVGLRPDGDLHGEIVDYGEGTDWAVARLIERTKKHRPAALVLVGTAAAFTLYPALCKELKLIGSVLEPKVLTNRDVAGAFGMFCDAVRGTTTGSEERGLTPPPRLHWRTDRYGDVLTSAVRGAIKRQINEGSAWDRANSSVDICPLVALTNGVFGFMSLPALPKPSSYVPPAPTSGNPLRSGSRLRSGRRLKI